MLARVLDRDGQQHSATQTRNRALADADRLAFLHAIWAAETTPAREQAYRDLLMNSLPPGYRRPPGHQAKWLWRTLRAVELADLDTAQTLAGAIAGRDLAGSRDIAVLDARIRHRLGILRSASARPLVGAASRPCRPRARAHRRDLRADGRAQRADRRARPPHPGPPPRSDQVPAHPLDRLE